MRTPAFTGNGSISGASRRRVASKDYPCASYRSILAKSPISRTATSSCPRQSSSIQSRAPSSSAGKDWKATSFAEDQSLKDNGLAKPRIITLKAKAKTGGKTSAPACQIRVGDETKDKVSYFVATAKVGQKTTKFSLGATRKR